MTVEELLHRLSSRELTEWMAYYALEPFGEERADMRAGIIASTIFNINRGKKTKSMKPEDFMPQFGRQVNDDSDDEVDAEIVAGKFRAFVAAKNAQVKRHGR